MILNGQIVTDKENIVVYLTLLFCCKVTFVIFLEPLTLKKRIAHESAAFGLSATDAYRV